MANETEIQQSKSSSSGPLEVVTLPMAFLVWFYFRAPSQIVEIWGNYLASNLNYFSVPLLLRTAFSPWHKDLEGYGRGFDFGRYARVFIMNGISRGIGFIIRFFTILFGLSVELLILFGGILFLLFWLAFPLVFAAVIVYAVSLVF